MQRASTSDNVLRYCAISNAAVQCLRRLSRRNRRMSSDIEPCAYRHLPLVWVGVAEPLAAATLWAKYSAAVKTEVHVSTT